MDSEGHEDRNTPYRPVMHCAVRNIPPPARAQRLDFPIAGGSHCLVRDE